MTVNRATELPSYRAAIASRRSTHGSRIPIMLTFLYLHTYSLLTYILTCLLAYLPVSKRFVRDRVGPLEKRETSGRAPLTVNRATELQYSNTPIFQYSSIPILQYPSCDGRATIGERRSSLVARGDGGRRPSFEILKSHYAYFTYILTYPNGFLTNLPKCLPSKPTSN